MLSSETRMPCSFHTQNAKMSREVTLTTVTSKKDTQITDYGKTSKADQWTGSFHCLKQYKVARTGGTAGHRVVGFWSHPLMTLKMILFHCICSKSVASGLQKEIWRVCARLDCCQVNWSRLERNESRGFPVYHILPYTVSWGLGKASDKITRISIAFWRVSLFCWLWQS